MIKDDFYTAISSPMDGLKNFRDPLLKLSKEYPWFSAAHIYLTKADHTLGHVDYNDHLKLAAIHSFDREELWKFIMKETLQEKAVAIDKQITLEVEEEQVQQEPIQQEQGSIEQEQIQQESLEQESGEGEEKRIVHADEFDDMQREILLEAISSTIELESDEGEDNDTSSGAIHRSKEEKATPALSPFAAFLLKKADESHWQEEHRTPSHITSEPSNDPVPPLVDKTLDPEEKKQSLIDQFIEKDPKITPGKAELFSTENLAKMSVVEDESFVTETMAQIYAKQGAWRKAKKAYEMLSLKFPEKSIYFANQIKKLQESRKSKK